MSVGGWMCTCVIQVAGTGFILALGPKAALVNAMDFTLELEQELNAGTSSCDLQAKGRRWWLLYSGASPSS